MKTIGLLLLGFSMHANAQAFKYNYEITCGPVLPIIEFLSKTQKEELSWVGLDIGDGSVYSLWQDKEGNWTLLKKTTEIACILGVGTKPKVI
jgi:hypothetical protein